MKVVTIGVYGAKEDEFFSALQAARVDTFCDVRWRRGLRGSEYAFANSARLQKRLAEMGIRYLHARNLAPPPELRQKQTVADKAAGIAKRKRSELSAAFVEAYREHCLAAFDSRTFVADLGPDTKVVALFCVEREPCACHRSVLAEQLQRDLGDQVEVSHLTPGAAAAI